MQRIVFGFVLLARILLGADPVCKDNQLKLTVMGSEGAMGSQYTEIAIQNVSSTNCRLQANFDLEQFDDRMIRMPITVTTKAEVNADGPGLPEITIKPQEQTAITVRTLNRTGYDESRHCASQIQISRSSASRQKPLLRYSTISCREDVNVTGFHPLH
jgi:hypothetical protein